MFCYKDITFCPFWKECKKGDGCKIALTDKRYEDGVRWSRRIHPEDILISTYSDKPECFEGK